MYAAQAATTLGYSIVKQNDDKVSLATFDDRVRGFIQPGNSLAQIHRMTRHTLMKSQRSKKTQMAECLTDLTGRMGRREIVMIFSDFFTDLDALEAALQRMKYNSHEVVLFHVLHHHERSFEFDGMGEVPGPGRRKPTSHPDRRHSSGIPRCISSIRNELRRRLPPQCHRTNTLGYESQFGQ